MSGFLKDSREGVEALAECFRRAQRAVFFTGAGMSTESGIPDFRSPGGLWTRMKPILFQDFIASEDVRKEAWSRKFELDKTLSEAEPNAGHKAIARLAEMGKATHVVTQNIDNLHQDSGLPEGSVIELHGNATYAHCLDCGLRHELEAIKKDFLATGRPPSCQDCGGIVKTATISFGQPMPEEAMRRAQNAAAACDLFLAVGSSLQVYPAAGFPAFAKRNGARLVFLNREATELDDLADLLIHDEIGPVLSEVPRLLNS